MRPLWHVLLHPPDILVPHASRLRFPGLFVVRLPFGRLCCFFPACAGPLRLGRHRQRHQLRFIPACAGQYRGRSLAVLGYVPAVPGSVPPSPGNLLPFSADHPGRGVVSVHGPPRRLGLVEALAVSGCTASRLTEKQVKTDKGVRTVRRETMIFPRHHQLDAVRKVTGGAQHRGDQRRPIEMALTGGAHDAGEHLLSIGAVAGAVATTHLVGDDSGPNGLFGAPVGGVDRLLDAGGSAGIELLIRVSLVRSQRGPPIESITYGSSSVAGPDGCHHSVTRPQTCRSLHSPDENRPANFPTGCFVISRSAVRVRSPAPIESTTYRDPDWNASAVCHHGVTNHQAAGRHRHTTGPSRRGRLNSSYAGSAVAPRLVQVNCALAAGRQEAGYPRAVHAPVVRRPTRAPRLRPVTAPPRRSTAPPRATRRPALVSFPLLLQPPRPQARAGRRRRR